MFVLTTHRHTGYIALVMYIAIPTNSLNREQFEYMYSAPEYFYLFLEYRGGVHPGQVCRRANTQDRQPVALTPTGNLD